MSNATSSQYTLELNEVLNEISVEQLFPDYSLPDFMNKDNLQNQFVNHYYFREIGFETIPRFVQRFQTLWLEKLQEYNDKFIAINNVLTQGNLLDTYHETINDENIFQATPQSSLNPDKQYATTRTYVNGKHSGSTGNLIFKNANDLINDHTNIINSFIAEFDILFMGVL